MTIVQETTAKPEPKKRGPRKQDTVNINLVYNTETKCYDLFTGTRKFPVRFEAPEEVRFLRYSLEHGLSHNSGKFQFDLAFTGDRLTSITNLTAKASLKPGEELTLVQSITVKLNDPLVNWIRVIAEIDVATALRIK